jgi:hypothetical protein
LEIGYVAEYFFPSEPITGASLVEDPKGGVLLVGGFSHKDKKALNTILKLSTSEDSWKKMPQMLKTPRFCHKAFFVPNNVANCY